MQFLSLVLILVVLMIQIVLGSKLRGTLILLEDIFAGLTDVSGSFN